MSIIKSPFEMTGSIRGVSFYKQYGSDKVIMRTKGGAQKNQIRKSPKFEKLRLHQTEWTGCVKMSGTLCNTMYHVKQLADFNVSATMNGFSKKLQALDTVNPIGQRSIELSRYKYLLDEFQLNRTRSFGSLLRISPVWEIKRETMEARVEIPYMNTDLQLVNPMNYPFFRIITSLGIVSDRFMDPETNKYLTNNPEINGAVLHQPTDWYSTNRVIEAQELILKFDTPRYTPTGDDFSLVLCIGVEFGKPGFDGQPLPVARAGCAKVLGVR